MSGENKRRPSDTGVDVIILLISDKGVEPHGVPGVLPGVCVMNAGVTCSFCDERALGEVIEAGWYAGVIA